MCQPRGSQRHRSRVQGARTGESKTRASILSGRICPLHQPSGILVTVAPFQPQAAMPMPRPAEMSSDRHEAKKRGPKTGLSPSHRLTTSSVGKVPSPIRGPYPQTSDDDTTSDVGLVDPTSHRKGRRNRGNRGS